MNRSGYGRDGCVAGAGTAGRKEGTKRDSGRQCTISSKKASEYRRKRNRPGLGAQEKLPYRNVSRILLSCRISRHSPRFGSHFGLILGPDHTRQQVSGTVSRSAPAPPPAVPYRRASRPRRAGSIGSADRSAAPGGRLSSRRQLRPTILPVSTPSTTSSSVAIRCTPSFSANGLSSSEGEAEQMVTVLPLLTWSATAVNAWGRISVSQKRFW